MKKFWYLGLTALVFALCATQITIAADNQEPTLTPVAGKKAEWQVSWDTGNLAAKEWKVYFSEDDGKTYKHVGTTAGADVKGKLGYCVIPDSKWEGREVKVKVEAVDAPTAYATMTTGNVKVPSTANAGENKGGQDGQEKPGTPSAPLTVLTPTAGEKIMNGSEYKITWSATNAPETFSILLTTDGGKTWNVIAEGLRGTEDSFNWNVNSAASREAMIRVKALSIIDQVIEDDSGMFEIASGK